MTILFDADEQFSSVYDLQIEVLSDKGTFTVLETQQQLIFEV